jgi:hypothetical protein
LKKVNQLIKAQIGGGKKNGKGKNKKYTLKDLIVGTNPTDKNGNPSGLRVTQANYFVSCCYYRNEVYIIEVSSLRKLKFKNRKYIKEVQNKYDGSLCDIMSIEEYGKFFRKIEFEKVIVDELPLDVILKTL